MTLIQQMRLIDAPAEMMRRAEKADHKTVWLDSDPEDRKVLVYITWHPETAKKAHAALEAAGVLCDTLLVDSDT